MLINLIISIIAFGCSFTCMGYENYVEIKSWLVGEWLSGVTPPVKVL